MAAVMAATFLRVPIERAGVIDAGAQPRGERKQRHEQTDETRHQETGQR